MDLLSIFGWVGSFLFAICCIPQSWMCFKQGHADGLSWPFLLLWFFGEVLTITYVWPKQDWPLLMNYAVNMICLVVIFRYKIWRRRWQ